MSLVQRLINTTITLQTGVFGSTGNNVSNISGLRTTFKGLAGGGAGLNHAEMAIYGMPLSDMNAATLLPAITQTGNNTLVVEAGDAINGMFLIFNGTIQRAWVDAQSMPQVCYRVIAYAGGDQAIAPAPPTSYAGGASVATIMGGIAGQAGWQFEDNGGAGATMLSNPYFPGTLRQQALDCAEAAGCEHMVDKGILAIWPPSSSRNASSTPLVSPQTGMVGYPMFDGASIIVRTLFNPAITHGGSIQVQSDLTPACGTWGLTKVEYELESMVPHGRWFQNLIATNRTQNVP